MGTPVRLADAVLVTSQTPGTGTYALGNAVSDGWFHPSDITPSLNGARVSYTAVDSLTAPTVREVGEGVLAAGAPWTLTRATIRRSKTGGVAGAAAINWPVGTRYIFITPLAVNTPQLDTDGWLRTGVVWEPVAGFPLNVTTQTSVDINLPSEGERFQLEFRGTLSAASFLTLRFDMGAGFLTDSTNYAHAFMLATSSGVSGGSSNDPFIYLTNAVLVGSFVRASCDIQPGDASFPLHTFGTFSGVSVGGGLQSMETRGRVSALGRAAKVRISAQAGTFSGRLMAYRARA